MPREPGTAVFDVAVIGAGAAGMMCALEAGKRGRSVVLIDHAAKLAEKIRISGGGRCNFTNINAGPEHYISANPHFCRSALARFTPQDFLDMLRKHRIRYHEKKLGQLFCDESAQQVIDMLKVECDHTGVKWRMPCRVEAVEKAECFLVRTDRGDIRAESLVVATGGLSIPQIGATAFGHNLARQFGLAVTPLRAGLVPLIFHPEDMEVFQGLSGVSLEAEVSCNGARFREDMLITHRGVSGPAILQISSYWHPGDELRIDLLPGTDAEALLRDQQGTTALLVTVLGHHLPKRFVHQWCEARFPIKPMNQYSAKTLAEIAAGLHDWRLVPAGTAGYKKAEVTLGGVDTAGLSSKTMEARKVPGLYFIGEVVDVTGHLGGFNFQWAWASGHAAGQYA